MGALFTWLARAVQWGGTAAIGYFANDIATWFGDVTGTSRTPAGASSSGGSEPSSKLPWWIAIPLFLIIGALLYLVVSVLIPKRYRK